MNPKAKIILYEFNDINSHMSAIINKLVRIANVQSYPTDIGKEIDKIHADLSIVDRQILKLKGRIQEIVR